MTDVSIQGAFDSVAGVGPLAAFMLLCIVVLLGIIAVMWKRMMAQDAEQNSSQRDVLVVLKGIEVTLLAINRELERRRDG